MSLTTIFTARARGEGLIPGFGGAITSSSEYQAVLRAGAIRRQRAQHMLAGKDLAGLRLDGAPAERRDSIAAENAYAYEWAEYLRGRFGKYSTRLDDHIHGGATHAVSYLRQLVRADATVPMASQGLTYIAPEVYKIRHPDLPCWEGKILDIDKRSDPAAETYAWYEMDNVGVARAASSYSITDIPMVNGPIASSNVGQIVPAMVGMETNFMDPRRAAFAASMGKPDFMIEVMKREACEKALAQFFNSLWFGGDSTLGIDGLMNNPIVETLPISGGTWAGKTSLQIFDDLNTMTWAIYRRTQGSLPDFGKIEITLPDGQYSLLSQPMTAAGTQSILAYFMETFAAGGNGTPKIRPESLFTAANSYAYNGGPAILSEDTALITYREGNLDRDPTFVLSQPIEVPAPVRTTGVGDVTYYHARGGGLKLPDAQRMLYVVGL